MGGNGDTGTDAAADGSERYKLAYEAAVHALNQQDGTLGNLRNRGTGLVTIATVIGSFAGYFGLGTKDKLLPAGYAIGLIIFIVLIVAICMFVLMPKRDWTFGPDAQDIMESKYSAPNGELYWSQALGMQKAISENELAIRKRAKAYAWAVVLLGLEAVYVVTVSLLSR
ncbi:hypothetical protein [Streptomyces sp. NPDC012888]|uniref:hypothetical protein n=1 Tax=Streptomyces sp. NPDC012888 TaxID=3364855 RepID=UPI0036BDE0BF